MAQLVTYNSIHKKQIVTKLFIICIGRMILKKWKIWKEKNTHQSLLEIRVNLSVKHVHLTHIYNVLIGEFVYIANILQTCHELFAL